MKKNKGFTLIELLAIIVILAIIAIITIPILLNVIENSRKGAAIDSAYGYRDAIQKYYLTQLNQNMDLSLNLNGTYTVLNGDLKRKEEEHNIKFTGNIPTKGTVMLENSRVILGCIEINGYAITIENSKVTLAEKGECKQGGDHAEDIGDHPVTFINPETVKDDTIYYNPNLAQYCTESEYNTNMQSTATEYPTNGCLKWYKFSENEDNSINLIMAHNTTKYTTWTKDDDYEDGASVGITYDTPITPLSSLAANDIRTESGPVTALKQLKADTSDWNDALLRNDSYTPTFGNKKYTINYTGYKARLISAEEINYIANHENDKYAFYFQTGKADIIPTYGNNETSKYSWLYDYTWDCISYGCTIQTPNGNTTSGYWTSTVAVVPSTNNIYGSAWYVNNKGMFTTLGAAPEPGSPNTNGSGIRPVITVGAVNNNVSNVTPAAETLIEISEINNSPVRIDHPAVTTNTATGKTIPALTAYRYMGANPDNYIYFNCSSYDLNQQNKTNCELWRIVSIENGKLKITTDTSIGIGPWDQGKSNNRKDSEENYIGINDWPTSDLYNFLNDKYLNNGTKTLSKPNSYYDSTFTLLSGAHGYINSTTKDLISTSNWYLGGVDGWGAADIYVDQSYEMERQNAIYNNDGFSRDNLVNSYIGLLYPSDYGYASSGCYNRIKILDDYYESICTNSNWLVKNNEAFWMISPYPGNPDTVYIKGSYGSIYFMEEDIYKIYEFEYEEDSPGLGIRPTLYINDKYHDKNIGITYDINDKENNAGSIDNPYKLIIN